MQLRFFWWKKVAAPVVFLMIFLVISWVFLPLHSQGRKIVTIPPGVDSLEIAHILSRHKVIKNKFVFVFLSRILGWEQGLKAGKYEFFAPSMLEVLEKLRKGQIKTHRVTFPEGLPKWEIAEMLSQRDIVGKEEFLAVVDNPGIYEGEFSFPLPEDSLEGYLYPDTYHFIEGETPEEIVRKFLSRFEEIILPLYEELHGEDKSSLQKLIILASIVEKEAQISSEKATIAGVFYNRLRKGMRLMADPTIKYALGDFSEKLDRQSLKTPSLYNTYLYFGSPPGPICSPGRESVYAALHPAKVDYLYFVARGDGSHQFSKDYSEHLRAVYQYQRG
ncbi:endolytic transglycosylase MltG [Candidatus Aerophobetes bacterium]|uniref:Endolytic murein transglycosylase n=1 Tax=Aerophobetes bacterium TaxID=2030807 RepID=A0A523V264_UNCAE|nr:MAG: endolytic transglycosylase MltG [Candidatus Aerophobetes bacterium]